MYIIKIGLYVRKMPDGDVACHFTIICIKKLKTLNYVF